MLAPITHRVPPVGYGPWEQVVADLCRGLTADGHEVTLFAPVGTDTPAHLVETVPYPMNEWPPDARPPDHRVWEEIHIATMAAHVAERQFDVVHSHLSVHPLGYARLLPVPMMTTLHGSAWNRAIHPALERYSDLPFVSLSDSERHFFPDLNYVATVHNGIDLNTFQPGAGKGGFILFAGRMAPEKQPHVAIEIAGAAGLPLKLAGPIEDKHHEYFSSRVRPMLDGQGIEYLGDLDRTEIIEVFGASAAVIMPLAWEEPFGLVAIEALASGTPVVGWRRGALPEIIRDGVTGALVDDVSGAVRALQHIDRLDRGECRSDAESRFSLDVMARRYAEAYEKVISPRSSSTDTVRNRIPSSAKP